MDFLGSKHKYSESESQANIYSDYRGFVMCYGCNLNSYDDIPLTTPKNVIRHLNKHKKAGDRLAPDKLFDEAYYKPEHFSRKKFTAYTEDEQKTLEYATFVAGKFSSNHAPVKVNREPDIKKIRYKSDTEGYNSYFNRIKRTIKLLKKKDSIPIRSFFSPKEIVKPNKIISPKFAGRANEIIHKTTTKTSFVKSKLSCYLSLPNHYPDSTVHDNIYHWQEDADYAVFFQPLVGMEILRFLEAEPNHPWAKRIISKMDETSRASFNTGENSSDNIDNDEDGTIRRVG